MTPDEAAQAAKRPRPGEPSPQQCPPAVPAMVCVGPPWGKIASCFVLVWSGCRVPLRWDQGTAALV
jgi:hypothetical protein